MPEANQVPRGKERKETPILARAVAAYDEILKKPPTPQRDRHEEQVLRIIYSVAPTV